jgi:hypothetical protein
VKINHRITARHDDPFWLEIDRLGLAFERGNANNVISVLNVTEDQPQWSEVERLLAEYDLGPHFLTNLFTKSEMDRAEWFEMSALGHHGYPQPEDEFGFVEATYDVSDYCEHCGIGGFQNAPFRLRTEPKASHSQFVQLNWVFDEFFVRSEARQGLSVAGLKGFEFRPAVLHVRSRTSAEVEQLSVINILPPALDSTGLQTVTCREHNEEWESTRRRFPNYRFATVNHYCGRVKYHLGHRGPLRFKRSALATALDIVKSNEWFGSGGQAFRLVLVSQRFREVVIKAKWRGLAFEPVELIECTT